MGEGLCPKHRERGAISVLELQQTTSDEFQARPKGPNRLRPKEGMSASPNLLWGMRGWVAPSVGRWRTGCETCCRSVVPKELSRGRSQVPVGPGQARRD